jgi:hypothetical protein
MAAAVVVVFGLGLAACGGSSSGTLADGVPLTVTPAPSGGYVDGQTITISVGANSHFAPNSSIKILQCADPGGGASGLPKSIANCDGNTIQAGTLVVARNGSFTQKGYVIYRLPSAQLAEVSSGAPVCNATHACVLYIGQNQEDFTKPKVFSASFTVRAKG